MNKQTIIFEANEQTLTFVSGDQNYASNTVDYVEAVFRLGENWDFDVIVAVWQSKTQKIATVLGDGVCIVPTEVLAETGVVKVNLAGSDIVSGEVEERLTTYPEFALLVDATAQTSGTETQPITPSQFEQFVGIVAEDADRAETAKEQAQGYAEDASEAKEQAQGYAEDAEGYKDSASESATQAGEYKDEAKGYAEQAEEDAQEIRSMRATANTLPAGSSATANYSDGLLTLGIPKGDKGATGATGNGIASAVLNADYTLTLNFTDGTHYTTPPIRGAQGVQGETGNGIESVYLTETHGAVKTYTILFTDGTTTTFDVTDGEVTLAELASVLPTDTASGAIASFPDGSDLFDYLSCIVNIEPVQAGSGTPAPDNVRPITGWTGCELVKSAINIFDGVLESGTINSTTGVEESSTTVKRSTHYFRVAPQGVYFSTASGTVGVRCYDANKAYLGNVAASTNNTFTTLENTRFVRFVMSNGVASNPVSINCPSTDTAYHAYNGTTYPITWQTEAGTVYGGTVDLVTGVLTVDRVGITYNGSEAWAARNYDANVYFYIKVGDNGTVVSNAIISDKFVQADVRDSTQTAGINIVNSTAYDGAFVYIRPENVTSYTLNTFKAWLANNPTQVVYELATPQTYQLDPVQVACLLGQNNVWADCGDIEEVKYKADVQLWVEKQLREINTAILALS